MSFIFAFKSIAIFKQLFWIFQNCLSEITFVKLVDSKIRVRVSNTMSLSLPAMHGQLVHERVKVPCCSRAVEIFRCMVTAASQDFIVPLRHCHPGLKKFTFSCAVKPGEQKKASERTLRSLPYPCFTNFWFPKITSLLQFKAMISSKLN